MLGWLFTTLATYVGYVALAVTMWVAVKNVVVPALTRTKLSGQPFKTKRVFITGASSGIGKAMALEFCRAGASVALVARRGDRLAEVEAECRAIQVEALSGGVGANPEVVSVVADVGVQAEVEAAVEAAVAALGGVDVLVANAGRGSNNVLFEDEDEEFSLFKAVMDVNYWGVLYCVKAALPHLVANEGSILAVSSVAGLVPTPRRTGYCPTKAALNSFADSLRYEVGDKVSVTTACPGYVMTEIHNEFMAATGAKRNTEKFLTADVAAQRMITALLNRDETFVMVPTVSFIPILKLILPQFLLSKLIISGSESAFTKMSKKQK